jgi:cytochrome P450
MPVAHVEANGKTPRVVPAGALLYDPRDPATIQNPLPSLLRLQDEDPVHWSPVLRAWVVTRYDDVRAIQINQAMSADRLTPFYESQPGEEQRKIWDIIRYLNTWVAFKDPPDHARLRQVMNRVMTPAMVRRLEDSVHDIVDHLLAKLHGRTHCDFISEFANPLPACVIMDMMGVPRSDMEPLKDWSNLIQPFLGNATASDNKYELAREGVVSMANYFRDVIHAREAKPGEDIVSHLVTFKAAGALTEDELIGMCMLFLFAGHETTTNLIGNGLRALMAHPDQMAKLKADPSLIDGAVEEALRYDGPTGALVRIVKVDHELMGKALSKGDRVFIMVNAANHDPRRFEAPERFDITRSPNPHLTFNSGVHFCLGAPLARSEGRIAIAKVIDAFPSIALDAPGVEYMDTLVMRGVRTMPVSLGAPAAI